jgi:hypothetical protein
MGSTSNACDGSASNRNEVKFSLCNGGEVGNPVPVLRAAAAAWAATMLSARTDIETGIKEP